MTWLDAVLLGIMEGLTEFLPVSSTGHLILLSEKLGLTDDAAKSVDVVIQLGAVLAVVVYYRARLVELCRGLLRRDAVNSRLGAALAIAFLPAAVLGLAVHKAIKERLFGTLPVAVAFIVGGVAMIGIEAWRRLGDVHGVDGLPEVTPRRAFAVGAAQVLSLWPGASRSMTTILGGELAGLSTATAAEFSFLLAIPVLGAATVFDLVKSRKVLLAAPGSGVALAIGMAVSFVVALAVIAAFLRSLKRVGLAPFGAYRLSLGTLMLYTALTHPGMNAPPVAHGVAGTAQAAHGGARPAALPVPAAGE